MDFIIGFPRTSRQHDSIIVVVDRLTKVAHFIPVKSNYSSSDVAQAFSKDIVSLHGVPKNIVSDKDAKFTSKSWKELFAGNAGNQEEYKGSISKQLKEFQVGKSLRIGSFAKMTPQFCGPFNILERIGPVAYELAMPPTMKVEPKGEFQLKPQCILQIKTLMLWNRAMEQVKVQCKHFGPDEATWEIVDQMQAMYPSLFIG
eukprot:PITA_32485